MSDIVVDGARVGVGRSGSPTFLFLHGLAGHHGEWSEVIDRLPPHVGIVATDLRGHGAHPARWVDDQSLVDDAAGFIDPADPAIVVGQSMGTIVAMRSAAERPELVRHLVIIEGDLAPMTEAALSALGAWFDTWPATFPDRHAAAEFFGADRPSTPAWVDGLKQTSDGLVARFDAQELVRGMRSIAATDRADLWTQVTAPTTIIVGDAGAIDTADTDRMVALRPGAELIRVENAGHDVHLDQPQAVADELARTAASRGDTSP